MKKVYFIQDLRMAIVQGKKKAVNRFDFAHVYNRHIIASTRQGYSRLADCEEVYDKNFKPGAKRVYLSRKEYEALGLGKPKKR